MTQNETLDEETRTRIDQEAQDLAPHFEEFLSVLDDSDPDSIAVRSIKVSVGTPYAANRYVLLAEIARFLGLVAVRVPGVSESNRVVYGSGVEAQVFGHPEYLKVCRKQFQRMDKFLVAQVDKREQRDIQSVNAFVLTFINEFRNECDSVCIKIMDKYDGDEDLKNVSARLNTYRRRVEAKVLENYPMLPRVRAES